MRDFEYDPKVVASEAEERGKLELQIKKQFVSCLDLRKLKLLVPTG